MNRWFSYGLLLSLKGGGLIIRGATVPQFHTQVLQSILLAGTREGGKSKIKIDRGIAIGGPIKVSKGA